MCLEMNVIRRATLIVLVAASLAACSSNDNNETDNNSTMNNTATMDAGNNSFVDVDNTGSEYAMQYQVLFDSLAFTTQPINQLNMLLLANLDQNLQV